MRPGGRRSAAPSRTRSSSTSACLTSCPTSPGSMRTWSRSIRSAGPPRTRWPCCWPWGTSTSGWAARTACCGPTSRPRPWRRTTRRSRPGWRRRRSPLPRRPSTASPPPPPSTDGPARPARPAQVAETKPTEAKPEAKPKRGAKLPGRKTETLGAALQQMGAVTAAQLAQALEIQSRTGERLGQVLLDMKIITEVQLAQAMGKQWGYRYVSLSDTKIDPDAVKLIPHSLDLRLRVMPINWERGRLALAMIDPLNVIAVDDVRLMTGQEVEPVIATEDELLAAISKHYQVEVP